MHANIILARRRQKDQDCLGFMRQSPPQEEIHCQCIKDHTLLHQAGKRVGKAYVLHQEATNREEELLH